MSKRETFFLTPSNHLGKSSEEEEKSNACVSVWVPAIDILETRHTYVLIAEVPGVEKGDIKIIIEDHVLIIKGERKANKLCSEQNYHCVETAHGKFNRAFPFPVKPDSEKMTASLTNGVLQITLPKMGN